MSAAQALTSNLYDCRDAFAATLDQVAERDNRIVIVVNDSVGSSKLGGFRKRWPERTINVGIAEQNMVGVGSGLANGGKIPWRQDPVRQRCLVLSDRPRHGADQGGRGLFERKCEARRAVTRRRIRRTWTYPPLDRGHGLAETLAQSRHHCARGPLETAQAVEAAAAHEGPVFLRITRFGVPKLPRPVDAQFEIGKAETLREGDDVAIIACGVMVTRALEAADRLAEGGVSARVVNMASIAPLDESAIRAAADLGAIVTVEEHSVRGGLGGAVAEVVAGYRPCPIRILGFPGFMPTGSPKFLFERFGLTSDGIEKAARGAIALRSS
jgi:transketolase